MCCAENISLELTLYRSRHFQIQFKKKLNLYKLCIACVLSRRARLKKIKGFEPGSRHFHFRDCVQGRPYDS